MHFQRSFGVERNSANVANVLGVGVDVLVSFQTWQVFEFFRAASEMCKRMKGSDGVFRLILTRSCIDMGTYRSE